MPDNKRRFSRIRISRPAVLNTAEGNALSTDRLLDLSIGGCLFPTSTALAPGLKCSLVITLAEEAPFQAITVTGRVVRCTEGAVAIQFESIDPDSLFLLQNLVRYNASEPDLIDQEIAKNPGIT